MKSHAIPILIVIWGILAGVSSYAEDLSLTNLPSIVDDNYKVDPYIRAAQRLQSMGQQAATQQLIELAKLAAISNTKSTANEQRTAILCRMLFTARQASTFKRAGFLGGARFFGEEYVVESHSYSKWPLEPIELVDGIPFLVAYTYGYEGIWDPHGAESYVRYCTTNCNWSSFQYTAKSDAQKKQALTKLIASPKWLRPLEAWEQESLREQIQ